MISDGSRAALWQRCQRPLSTDHPPTCQLLSRPGRGAGIEQSRCRLLSLGLGATSRVGQGHRHSYHVRSYCVAAFTAFSAFSSRLLRLSCIQCTIRKSEREGTPGLPVSTAWWSQMCRVLFHIKLNHPGPNFRAGHLYKRVGGHMPGAIASGRR
jgi:hypothetical protein